MLRLKPTVISLAMGEVKDTDYRRRTQSFFDPEISPTHTRPGPIGGREQPSEDLAGSNVPWSAIDSQASRFGTEKEGLSSPALPSRDPLGRSTDHSIDSHRSQGAVIPLDAIRDPAAQWRPLDQSQPTREPDEPDLPSLAPEQIVAESGSMMRDSLRPSNLVPAQKSSRGQVSAPSSEMDIDSSPQNGQASRGYEQQNVLLSPPPTDPIDPPGASQHPASTEAGTSPDRASDVRQHPPTTPARRSSRNANVGNIYDNNQSGQPSSAFRFPTQELVLRPAAHASSSREAPEQTAGGRRPNRDNDRTRPTRTPRSQRTSRLPVYDDSLPAATQPRTPQHLPEARHQSRLQGSYTVPFRRTSPRRQVQRQTPTISRRQRRAMGRTPSPPGLQTPGYLGLYGGIENTDDAELFEESSRYLDMLRSQARERGSP